MLFCNQIAREIGLNIKRELSRPFGGLKKIRPMMKLREADVINSVLRHLQPAACLEWGSGYSTLYFPEQLPETTTWTALEHHEDWASTVNSLLNRENTSVHLIKPENEDWFSRNDDGNYEDFKNYVNFPEGEYDFILVDGRARTACLERASRLLASRGIVILHDANRKRYHEAFSNFTHSLLLEDYRDTIGGICLLSNGRDFDTVLDTQKHQKAWKKYTQKLADRFKLFSHDI